MGDGRPDEPLTVIALTGLARSGKDTIARMLTASTGAQRIALADPLRAAFAAVSGPGWDAHKELESASKTTRWMLQTLGTECRHDVGNPTLWSDVALTTIRFFSHHHPTPRRRFVIADLRYPAEADRFRAVLARWGGRLDVWRVVRPGVGPIAESGHSSETSVADVREDAVIANAGTIADLAGAVARVWRERGRAINGRGN